MTRARRRLPLAIAPAAIALAAALAGCQAGGPREAPQAGSGVADLALPGGGTERILYRAPEHPVAVLILFAGNDGVLALDSAGRFRQLGGNFLIRTRDQWHARGFATVAADAPSDSGRWGAGKPEVLRAIIAHVRSHTTAPVWLVGTSMGTIRAAYGAAHLNDGEIAGLVLTSSVSRPGGRLSTETVFSSELDRVAVPTLVVAHAGDRCFVTPPGDADSIRRALTRAPRTEILRFEGGSPPRSGECDAFSEHGYYGIETRVVDGVTAWIKAS